MAKDWQELTRMTHGSPLVIERIRLVDREIAIEGEFDLPPLAALPLEDQVFIAAFVRCHGSIKEMERLYGVSYPTIKSRLNQIGEQLGFAGISISSNEEEVISQLERGELSIEQALERLEKR